MATLEDIEAVIATLPRAERVRLAQRLVGEWSDAYPGVESSPDVCGGEACIVRTRVPNWLLERMRRGGLAESAILSNCPAITSQDLVNAWGNAASHREDRASDRRQ